MVREIKLLIVDVDGTLTDGCYYYVEGETPKLMKRFHTRDFHGMKCLHKLGVEIAVVTRAEDLLTRYRVENASPFAQYFGGVVDKFELISRTYIKSGRYTWDDIAFIGDDIPDLPLIINASLAACPSDADPLLLERLKEKDDYYVMNAQGGQGAVREFINLIMQMRSDNHGIIKHLAGC